MQQVTAHGWDIIYYNKNKKFLEVYYALHEKSP